MDGLRIFEARRYSGVLIDDPGLSSPGAVLERLSIAKSRQFDVTTQVDGWHVVRGRILSDTPHYSSTSAPRTPGGSYLTDLYVAANIRGSSKVLLASPYVRLLASCIENLDDHPKLGRVQFLKPDMNALFTHFERARTTQMSATRISVLMEGDVGLELVSLSGRNPLRSDLRHALLEVASPYSLRVKGTYVHSRGTNMHADRHGNIWWHLASEDSLTNVLAFVDILLKAGRLTRTTSSPLRRASQEDEN